VAGAVISSDDGGGDEPTVATAAQDGPLPGGGDRIFPGRRVVAFYGAPQDPELGALGAGPPGRVARQLRQQAAAYERPSAQVLPAFELIAAVANADPGDDGLYRTRQPASVIRTYLKLARKTDSLLVLDVQPGRSDFLTEVQALEPFLREPDVSLALDPEWNMGATGIPGEEIGSVDSSEVNAVSEYLQELVDRYELPQKLLVVHQFTEDMITEPDELAELPDVAVTLNVDGFGDRPNKIAKYRELRPTGPIKRYPTGFKLFYQEDLNLMTPAQVIGLRPAPSFVVYE
jgi:hypothetical protein